MTVSCYLRHLSDVLKEAGREVTKENKRTIDKALHSIAGVEYKNCSSTWRELKKMLQNEGGRKEIVQKLREL